MKVWAVLAIAVVAFSHESLDAQTTVRNADRIEELALQLKSTQDELRQAQTQLSALYPENLPATLMRD